MRFYSVPADSPILHRRALTDDDIDALLERHYIGKVTPPRSAPAPVKVTRRSVCEDDVCPICYGTFDNGGDVAWCSSGCGGNFHAKCVQAWIDSKLDRGEYGSCPLCRARMDFPDCSGHLIIKMANEIEKTDSEERQAIVREFVKSKGLREIEEFLEEARITIERERELYEEQQKRLEIAIANQRKASEELERRMEPTTDVPVTVPPVVSIKVPDILTRGPDGVIRGVLATKLRQSNDVGIVRPSTTLAKRNEDVLRNRLQTPGEAKVMMSKTAPLLKLTEIRGNISDALTFDQQRLESERRVKDLTQKVTLTPVRKRRAPSTKPRQQRLSWIGWSS